MKFHAENAEGAEFLNHGFSRDDRGDATRILAEQKAKVAVEELVKNHEAEISKLISLHDDDKPAFALSYGG